MTPEERSRLRDLIFQAEQVFDNPHNDTLDPSIKGLTLRQVEDIALDYVDKLLAERSVPVIKQPRDWASLMKEFEGLLIAYLEAREQDSDDGDSDDDLAIVAWERLKDFFRRHVGNNAQGVPQSIVDAYERYLKANDDESSDNEFRNARMALIDAVGEIVDAQGEVKS